MLRAFEVPPPGYGVNTDFDGSRTAFDELPEDLKEDLLREDYVAAHSIAHSRKLASPEFFNDLDATDGENVFTPNCIASSAKWLHESVHWGTNSSK